MAGQYYDAETGLHYNYHRYYDPATGRYLTPDPIGLVGGINPFVYAYNNAANLLDPFGLKPGDLFLNVDDAAKDAIDYIMSTRTQGNKDPEWSGWIYRTKKPDGEIRFSYTEPVCGETNKLKSSTFNQPEPGNKKMTIYHTHPGTGYNVGQFSGDDYSWSALNYKPIYMGTNTGLLKKYNANSFKDKPPEEITIREHY